jgi:hypothetical protein
MTESQRRAAGILIIALLAGAVLQHIAQLEAQELGLSVLEFAALGLGAGALLKRTAFHAAG